MFDGSFAGFLSAVHSGMEQRVAGARFSAAGDAPDLPLFGPGCQVNTSLPRARRIWEDLGLKGTKAQKRVYYSFLHKNPELLPVIYHYIAGVLYPELPGPVPSLAHMGAELDPPTLSVAKEREELEGKLHFYPNSEGLWYCEIFPEHNILPLLSRFCRNRFQADPWLVLDARRNLCLRSACGALVLGPMADSRRPDRSYVA
jgi:probable DNA metabolism protein